MHNDDLCAFKTLLIMMAKVCSMLHIIANHLSFDEKSCNKVAYTMFMAKNPVQSHIFDQLFGFADGGCVSEMHLFRY